MAVVPNGWAYLDKSTNSVLKAGATMPTPDVGDQYYGITSSNTVDYSKPVYTYYNQETVSYAVTNSGVDQISYNIPTGWRIDNYTSYTITTLSVASTINNKNVVYVKIYNNNKITSISLPDTVVGVQLMNNTVLTQITGTLGSALKEFTCYNSIKLKTVPSFANATNLTNWNHAFRNCAALTTITALPPNVVALVRAFENCSSLTSVPAIPSTVKDMAFLCNGCIALTTAPSNNSTIALYMQNAFCGCSNLIDASNFNIPLTLINGQEMFKGCSNLKTSPSVIRGTNANIYRMFYECISLITSPSFEGTYINMNSLFYKCSSLEVAPVIPNGSQTMGWAFGECTSLREVPYIPSTVNVLYNCFYNCTSLEWISIRLNNNNTSSFNYMFTGCINLTGIIYLDGTYVAPCDHMFYDTTKTIIVAGDETAVNAFVAQQNNNNVYKWLNVNYTNISSVRTDINGILDDAGEYMQLSIDFTCPVVDYSKLYVPKIYIKNNQIAPLQNWVLTYINEQETKIIKEIENSTDVEAARIEANDVVASGNFTTIFSANNLSEGTALTIYIPTSNSQVATDWNNSNHQYVIGTFYWNGTLGSAIFTGETFIFDALPDGTAFKIGGPVYEDETGFIVGNAGSTPYLSTFNGPAIFNDNIYININENASTGTLDGDLYNIINILQWDDILN